MRQPDPARLILVAAPTAARLVASPGSVPRRQVHKIAGAAPAALAVLLATLPHPAAAQNPVLAHSTEGRVHLGLGAGVRAAQLTWQMAGRHSLSELDYDDLRVPTVGVSGAVVLRRWESHRVILFSEARVGWVSGGRGRDSDFRYDRFGGGERRSTMEITGNGAHSWLWGLGWSYELGAGGLLDTVSLWAGRRREEIRLRKENGAHVLPEGRSDASLEGLDSRYHASWRGRWVGGAVAGSVGRNAVALRVRAPFLTKYRAEGVWNLRDDLAQSPSFEQTSKREDPSSDDLAVAVAVRRPLLDGFAAHLYVEHERKVFRSGRDIARYVRRHQFDQPRPASSHMPKIAWRATSLRATLSYTF